MTKEQISMQSLCRMAASQAIEDEVDLYITFLNGELSMLPVADHLQDPFSRRVQTIDARAKAAWQPRSPPTARSAPKRQRTKESIMKRKLIAATCAAALMTALGGASQAQGVPQTVSLMKIDPATLATGYRSSKVVGAVIVNDADEKVGVIDDLIVTRDGKVPYAVLSVGGFLSVGSRYVVVLASDLLVRDNHMVLPGATKESLRDLPEYTYSK